MPNNTTIFYAYPSQPPTVNEAIQSAIQAISEDADAKQFRVRFRPWPEMDISGRDLARTVLRQIDRADVFACDLTYPNSNVSFELGFAIARRKRVFASLDAGINSAHRDFETFNFELTGLGYSPYLNHVELAQRLVEDRPWATLNETLLDSRFGSNFPRPERPKPKPR